MRWLIKISLLYSSVNVSCLLDHFVDSEEIVYRSDCADTYVHADVVLIARRDASKTSTSNTFNL